MCSLIMMLLMLNLNKNMQGSFKIQPHSLGPKPTIKVGLPGKGKEDQKLKWIKKKRNSSHVPYFVSGSDHSKHNHTPPIKKRKEKKNKIKG